LWASVCHCRSLLNAVSKAWQTRSLTIADSSQKARLKSKASLAFKATKGTIQLQNKLLAAARTQPGSEISMGTDRIQLVHLKGRRQKIKIEGSEKKHKTH